MEVKILIYGFIILTICIFGIGYYVIEWWDYEEWWDNGNLLGKFIICLILLICLPYIIIKYLCLGIKYVLLLFKDCLFPRQADRWTYEIPYPSSIAVRYIKQNKIVYTIRSKNDRAIMILHTKKDYKKVCKIICDTESEN